MKLKLVLASLLAACVCPAWSAEINAGAQGDAEAARAASHIKPDRIVPYKTTGNVTLRMSIFNPPGPRAGQQTPAIIFFHGGGFQVGEPANFYPQAQYLASRGMVALAPEYRLKTRHKATPLDAAADAKSAVRWMRNHAAELGIDTNRIAVAGGSAGGYLAAATATLPLHNEPGEDTTISCRPNVLVLFNTGMNAGPGSKSYQRNSALGDFKWQDVSPLHNLTRPFPPTIHFLGTSDKNISVESGKLMKAEIEKIGGRCDLRLYEGMEHGFFNYGRHDNRYFTLTLIEVDKFLTSVGYLSGQPTLKPAP